MRRTGSRCTSIAARRSFGEAEEREYLHHLKLVEGASAAAQKMALAGIRFLYTVRLGRPEVVANIPWPKGVRKLPEVMARCNAKEVYTLLFEAGHATLSELAADAWGARLGITAVLHTWTRELHFHPHIHCVVTGGGLSLDGTRWVPHTRYLFPSRRMRALFRARLLAGLARLRAEGLLLLPDETEDHTDEGAWKALIASLPGKEQWVVYVKAPFGRSTHVLRYLGRYTHRAALSDQRLVAFDDHGVTFRTRGDQILTLAPDEFIRRFLLHILPRRFHKVRHYGLYAPAATKGTLARAGELLGKGDRESAPPHDPAETWDAFLLRLTGKDPLLCPKCKAARLERRHLPDLPPRKPP